VYQLKFLWKNIHGNIYVKASGRKRHYGIGIVLKSATEAKEYKTTVVGNRNCIYETNCMFHLLGDIDWDQAKLNIIKLTTASVAFN